ncbi:MAG: polyprenyl synthetase family protein [Bacteroidales bacterium]|nr:polyprenyl synthetase family protein [Bacteroidales bacterium]
MLGFSEAQHIINERLNKLSLKNEPVELYEPVRYILSIGGKRLRPALVLMSCSLYTDSVDHAIQPALGIEVFHNFTLLHDDIMDQSKVRRNQPTVHNKWNNNIAILSGDTMSILSYRYISQCPEDQLKDVLELFNTTALEVCEGQQFDLNFENEMQVGVSDYIRMIELKTSVLIAASLKLGAILGRASTEDRHHLYEFGRNLGIAFQIRDDYLDTFGDPDKFGKRIGNDIVTNKKTYLMIMALELSRGKHHDELNQLLQNSDIEPEEKINAVKNIYTQLEVGKISELKAQEYYDRSLLSLRNVSVAGDKKEALFQFASELMERET